MAYIRLDMEALASNVEVVRDRSEGEFAAVLKDNAYGHGLRPIAQELSRLGVGRAVVRKRWEGEEIADLFDYILILSDLPQRDRFHYAINDLSGLSKAPSGARIELKVDTGMHRNGIEPHQLEEAFRMVKERGLLLTGVFTHYRSGDELSSELFWQRERWRRVKEEVRSLSSRYSLPLPHFHAPNSAALFRAGRDRDEFARVGIALYGYIEYPPLFDLPPLRPVLSLWGRRISTRRLKRGERVGYGGLFEAPRDMVVSTYDVGYGDGIFRALTECAGGRILGRVSMDSIVLEGEAEELPIIEDAREMAHRLGTISYEVLVKLSPFIDRLR
ncbi:MAG: alanine racemase [Epsilonproteobacteria bacterium]|nr:alanine racemase [Campylobacterota bacterium]NPA56652.1 alanine racemase [Campylobacterota bacterium]